MILTKPRPTRKIEKHPLQPSVTVEQICAFDADKPETFTPSDTLNQILTAMFRVKPVSLITLGKYLDVGPKKLAGAIEIITGMKYSEVREKLVKSSLERKQKEHPDWTVDHLAKSVGFADNSAVWRMDHRNKRKEEYRQRKAYMNRPLEERMRMQEEFKRQQQELMRLRMEELGLSSEKQ